jgi:hypothetical protein
MCEYLNFPIFIPSLEIQIRIPEHIAHIHLQAQELEAKQVLGGSRKDDIRLIDNLTSL